MIKLLEKADYSLYEDFILEDKSNLLYYSIKYKLLLEDFLNCKSEYWICVENNRIVGVLPLMKKEGKFGIVYNSLPFYGSNGGIYTINDEAFNLLVLKYNSIAKDKETASINLITNPLLKNNYNNIISNVKDYRTGQWTSINYKDDIDIKIMQSYHYKTRNMVRKAIKANINIEIDNSQLDFLYKTHYDNITSIGGKAKDKRFFDKIDKYFTAGKDYNIYIAKLENKIIAAVLLFYYNKTVEYYTPAAVSEYRNYQPTSLIIYRAMIDSAQNNFIWWNWGGTWATQDGVYKFKNRFGAVDKKYDYYIQINNNEIYNATKEELLTEYTDFYVLPFNLLNNG